MSTKDGMDIALVVYDRENKKLHFSGANNPVYFVRNGKLTEIFGDKQPIGIFMGKQKNFTMHTINIEKDDSIYMFSDGYADQFGGPKGKKFKYKRFQELILSISNKQMSEQRKIFSSTIKNWKGDLDQVDDMLILGVRF